MIGRILAQLHRGRSLALTLALSVALASCVLPAKEPPHPQAITDEQLGLGSVAVESAAEGWWKSFDDEQLDRLIAHALSNSPTLAEASARLRQAQAQADAAHAGLLPRVTLDASANRQHAPEQYLIPPPLAGTDYWMAQAGANLSWDLDFWGRQAQAVAQAHALAQAANLEIDNARLMLAGAIAQAYVQLYRSNALADIAERAEAQRQHILDITQKRVAAGLDTRLELRAAEGALPQARVERAQAQAAADLAVHQLATICGDGAEAYASIQKPQINLDAALALPTELPINLLARRPDVLAARLQIQAADAQRLAAKAAFYPDVSLRAIAGFGAFGLSNLFELGARGYTVGPMISLPLFDAGRLQAQYGGANAALDGSIARYNDTVLQAVQQASDQLTRIDALNRERADQQLSLDATEDAYRIAEERYRAGLATYLSVLNAETQVLGARRASIDIVADLTVARVTLLLALGGSFDPTATTTLASAQTPATATTSSNEATPQIIP